MRRDASRIGQARDPLARRGPLESWRIVALDLVASIDTLIVEGFIVEGFFQGRPGSSTPLPRRGAVAQGAVVVHRRGEATPGAGAPRTFSIGPTRR